MSVYSQTSSNYLSPVNFIRCLKCAYTRVTLDGLMPFDSNDVRCNECHSTCGGATHKHVMSSVHNIDETVTKKLATNAAERKHLVAEKLSYFI